MEFEKWLKTFAFGVEPGEFEFDQYKKDSFDCYCKKSPCVCKSEYLKWNEIPYAGEKEPPTNPEEPYSGSWTMYNLKRHRSLFFTKPEGEPAYFTILNPNYIDFEKQLELVLKTKEKLDPNKKTIARYWGTGVATKQWVPIIDRLIDTYHVTAPRAARILAAAHSAMNDAFVVTWYYKFLWSVARPNQYDRDLATIVCTPRHPTYPSGHAAIAGCAAEILKYYFPAESERLDELADEAALSRLYALVHFPIDNSVGLSLGKQVARVAINKLRQQTNSQGDSIDTLYTEPLGAEIPPAPYPEGQTIPFEFDLSSTSLIQKEKKEIGGRGVERRREEFRKKKDGND
ncbi:vanadium-dependent haloperoxidase [Bacillus spongiae]|uniref:Vanadium-dependent haloperoxidase n=1 Tax=Bacillus spongiae TaxID=2683610 RepID=A0ABU8HCG9_9BACI